MGEKEMQGRGAGRERRLEEWACRVWERDTSGESVREYCRRVGIRESVYYYWQRKVQESKGEQSAEEAVSLGNLSPSGFAEVRVIHPSKESELSESESKISIRISGMSIETDSRYPTEKLAALLRELVGLC